MYIDKEFLKNLVAISGELDFDIQYVEYSVENSCSNRNDISVRPYAEKLCDSNKEARNSNMKGRDRSCRNSDCNKESIGVFYDKSKSYINEEFAWNDTFYDLYSLACFYTGHYKEAICYIKKAIELNPIDRYQTNLEYFLPYSQEV